MSAALAFRQLAAAEFTDSGQWYENQRPGLGAEFVAEVEKVLNLIAEDPLRFPVVLKDIREAAVCRFPLAVYYRVRTNRVIIVAVFHCTRDPAIWQSRD